MTTDPTLHEIARRQDESNSAMRDLTAALNRVSERIDALPETMERKYVRKEVWEQRNLRVDAALSSLTDTLREHAKQTQDQFDRLSAAVRWVVAAVLIPVVLAVFALLNQHGGIG